ncbi:Uncharacterized protein, DUF1810 family [Flavobacterium omnivorum]|uniref:Uncharacterized protein, DUF1810 family n=1 Tax=Flavobacterium omnivorum TaxID=178355 RepID=A0A1G8H3C4_9FLAO|nr:DUF1810 domain-containing protein [Flavobacterium omnivorum]SDI01103.1 Uncharacterized protein, DUF1810 family [Flavobacterium omnivorum]
MTDNNELIKFLDAQNQVYLQALSEIKNGKKETHWMWYIFPQIKGLGSSETAQYYGIKDLNEANAYLQHPILGKHLVEITEGVLNLKGKTATQIFGTPDDMKLRSCMTLFTNVENANPVFQKVLEKYFNGLSDELTLQLLNMITRKE